VAIGTEPPAKPLVNPTSGALQIVALVLAIPALAWGIFVADGILFPGTCGDFSGAIVFALVVCWILNLPTGLLVAGIGVLAKRGPASLRKACIAVGVVSLLLPILDTSLMGNFRCR
jgi:hypothetical protein